MTITYSFSECDTELRVIRDLAAPLLANPEHLDLFRGQLQQIRYSRSPARWEIPADKPLKTVKSEGEYEKGRRRGAHTDLRGELSSVWQIKPLPAKKRTLLPDTFVVAGKASTLLRLVQTAEDATTEFVAWRFEIGDAASPGVFFHVQIGEDRPDAEHYHQLPVPRLPSTPITPMLGLEYMLLEIFQDRWPERLVARPDDVGAWRNVQRPRIKRFLEWQSEVLEKRSGSPVADLKDEKPRPDLLVQDAPLLA